MNNLGNLNNMNNMNNINRNNMSNMTLQGLPVNSLLNPINNNISMNINVMNQPFNQINNQNKMHLEESVNKEEYDLLFNKYEKLRLDYEEIKINCNIKLNEKQILESSSFKSIVEQASNNFSIIDQLKDLYVKLKIKYDETVKDHEVDVKKIEDKMFKSNENYKKKFLELKEDYYKVKYDLSYSKSKLQELEAIKSDSLNFNSIYEFFDKEKKRLNEELSNIIKLLSEQREKYSNESEKNNTLTEENIVLKNEIENLKDQILKNSINNHSNNNNNGENNLSLKENKDGVSSITRDANTTSNSIVNSVFTEERNWKYKQQELMNSIKQKKEKLIIFDKKYSKLKEELQAEKHINESLLREIEANENGLKDMNSQIIQLQEQISQENLKVAKLTKEKINDQKNLDKLTSEREINKNLVTLHKNQKLEMENQMKKLSEDIKTCKNYLNNSNDIVISKDQELSYKDKFINSNFENKIKEIQSMYDQQKIVMDELNREKASLINNIELKPVTNDKKSQILNNEKISEMKEELECLRVNIFI